jgi:ubiquinone/menaquinone biosynthesis C-methylase UbiE
MATSQDAIYSLSDYHEQKHGASAKASELITRYRTQKFGALVGNPNSEILEVGIGPGWNMIRLPARRRVGQDVTLAYAGQLRDCGVEFVSDLSELSGQQFDAVILSHVLEHLLEPSQMLAKLRTLLKPQGKLLILVPLESPVRRTSAKDKDHHLFSWNVQTLNGFLAACGFTVASCKVRRKGYDRYAAELSVRLGGGFRLYKFLLWLLQAIRPCHEIQAIACRQSDRAHGQHGLEVKVSGTEVHLS